MFSNSKKILISGSHRSGTTWVWRILKSGNCSSALSEPLNKNGKFAEQFNLDCWFPHFPPDQKSTEVKETLDSLLAARTNHSRKGLINFLRKGRSFELIKDPVGIFAAEWYYKQYQTENIIMIRHPAAFACSLLRVGWKHDFNDFVKSKNVPPDVVELLWGKIEREAAKSSNTIANATLLWSVIYCHVATLYNKYRDNPRWHFVRHEDLAGDPQKELSSLINSLGLKEIPRQTRTIQEICYDKTQVDLDNKQVQVTKRDSKATVKKWKKLLTREQIEAIRQESNEIWPVFYDESEWL